MMKGARTIMPGSSVSKSVTIGVIILCASIFFMPGTPTQSEPSTDTSSDTADTAIAYVSSSTDNQAIRLINPDGTNDRTLWRVPTEINPDIGIGTLDWHPDGTELLFDSGHNWQRSLEIRDLYAVTPDGSALRRVSNPPGVEAYDTYPTGAVTFEVDAAEQGDVQVYIKGATEPITYFADISSTYQITQTLADLGDGVRQYIRLWDPEPTSYSCNYSEEGWVDVVSGELTDAGSISFDPVTSARSCPRLFSPSWSHDGSNILYLYREPTTGADPVNNIWQISAQPAIGSLGSNVLDMNNYVDRGQLYRVAFAPTASRSDEMLFLQQEALQDLIFAGTTTNPANHSRIDVGQCPRTSCDILDIAWLPDGSGFLFAQYEEGTSQPASGVIYRYTFADSALTEIVRLTGEAIGTFAIAPDGTAIAFERGPTLSDTVDEVNQGPKVQCPCELWRVQSDGSGLQQLAADGRAPAWSVTKPATEPAPTSQVWLPLLISP